MRTYVTRSKKLTITVEVEGVKRNLLFDRGIRHEGLSAIMIKDEAVYKALEATPAFNAEFWFYEEAPEVAPAIRPVSNKKIYYKKGQEPKSETPEVVIETPEVVAEETPESAEEVIEPTTDISPEVAGVVDYPEIVTGQKAKLLLLSKIPGSTHAMFVNSQKIREVAKANNISFSNWNS